MAPQRAAPRKKPTKPYPSFPLTSHNNGQWCKKIRGKLHFFGVWADHEAALDNYLRVAADLHAGRQPRQANLYPDGVTVKEMCDRYLTYQFRRAEAGEIGHRWFEDCRCVLKVFSQQVGTQRITMDLLPDDFDRFRQRLIRRGLTTKGRGLGVHALNRAITVVRGAFKYAYETDLIERPMKYGKSFDRPSATAKRKVRRAAEQENGKRLFEPRELDRLLEAASGQMRAMIFLGINGGFGNIDCARLPIKAADLDGAIVEFDRPKTGIERVAPLWPETVAALRQVLEERPVARTKDWARLLFLTPSGLPWIRETIQRSEGNTVQKVSRVDTISKEFGELLTQLGLKRKGVGFYALRHTFRTWADETGDQHAIHRIMGHAIPGMSGIYVERIELDRLRAVVDHVRSKLELG